MVISLLLFRSYRIHCKGAPEIILNLCRSYLTPDGQTEELTDELRTKLNEEIIRNMGKEGLRTIALAYKDLGSRDDYSAMESVDYDEVEQEMVWIGVFGIQDPLRAGLNQIYR